jgi:hypothetical protein
MLHQDCLVGLLGLTDSICDAGCVLPARIATSCKAAALCMDPAIPTCANVNAALSFTTITHLVIDQLQGRFMEVAKHE